MFRRLRVLAAFFMVPLVIFVTPQTAAAAGPWTTVHIDIGVPDVAGADIPGEDCYFSLQQSGGTFGYLNVGANGYCTGLPDVSWGFAQDFEAGATVTISAQGVTAAGSPCAGGESSTLGAHSLNGTLRVAGSIPAMSFSMSGVDDCSVTQVCIDSRGTSGCVTVDIPAIPVDETPPAVPCGIGTPTLVVEVEREAVGDYNFRDHVYLKLTTVGNPLATGKFAVAVQNYGGGPQTHLNFDTSNRVLLQSIMFAKSGAQPLETAVGWSKPAGMRMQVYGHSFPGSLNGTFADNNAIVLPSTVPVPDTGSPYMGWTSSAQCRFYFGAKILDDPTSDGDEPFGDGLGGGGPIVTEPLPEPVIDQPDPIADPSEDGDWWGLILGVLRGIWASLKTGFLAVANAITSLPGRIADAFEGMFSGLFVPEDGFLESRFSTVENKWSETSPAKYADAVGDFSVGAGSGCAGLPLSVALPGGVQVDERIGAACTGSMASAASVVRAVLTAALVVSGLFACVRAVGSGLGWDPGVGRAGGSS